MAVRLSWTVVMGALGALALGAILGACQSDAAVPGAADDGGPPADLTDAAPDAPYEHVYPAPHAPLPSVDLRIADRAKVQAHQKVVTIAFDGDPVKARVEAFTDMIGATDWWAQTTREYCTDTGTDGCIAPTTVLAHVTLNGPPPASLTPLGVEDLLQQLIGSGAVPPPKDDVIYMLLFPPSVKLGEPGFESCDAFDGYHGLLKALVPVPVDGDGGVDNDAGGDAGMDDGGDAGGGRTFAKAVYAVQAQCSGGEAETTVGVGHELIEAATDPDGFGFNVADPAWSTFFYPEVGDLCDYEPRQIVGGFTVQSGWSNVAARAGKNPCVPSVLGDIYFNAAPAVQRVSLKVGESATVEVMPFSSAATPDWQLDALDLSTLYGDPAALHLTLDRDQVHNGLPVTLTVKLLRTPDPLPTGNRAAVAVLASKQGKSERYWPLLVVPK